MKKPGRDHVPSYDAFPSGHVTTALVTVIVIAENYSDIKWFKPVGYSITGLLAISMVNKEIVKNQIIPQGWVHIIPHPNY
jgi:hypothetical protein